MVASVSPCVSAFSLALDSIAEWGKFPKFCIDTYRWGDKFFNSYDSAYVVGTGTKFNVKIVTDSWMDNYHFALIDNKQINMRTQPSTSAGAYLTYLAVSFGYDINISNLFGGVANARSRYRLGFNCSLLSVEAHWENNDVGTTLTRFGDYNNLRLAFDGIHIGSWGIDTYYFFNNNKYSQAAAFNFSKIQRRSQGSFYAGLSIYSQKYDFDFNHLPSFITANLPEWWTDRHFKVSTHNYGFRLGYGYNWVFAPKWILGTSFSPTIGISSGYVNSDKKDTNLSLYIRGKLSLVWNSGKWFAGIIGNLNSSIITDRKTVFIGQEWSVSTAVGYRFNIW